MSLTSTINYDNASNFTFDTSVVEIVGSDAKLKLLDLQPNELMLASSILGADADRSIGAVTATALNGAVLVDIAGKQYMDLSDSVPGAARAFRYIGTNGAIANTGTIRYKVIPDYNVSPATNRMHFRFSTTTANAVWLIHQASQNIQVRIYNSTGAAFTSKNFGNWSAVQGQEYEFEFNIDTATGVARLFIDGTQFGTDMVTAQARTSTMDFVAAGDCTGVNPVQAFIRDFQVFNTVQHVADFAGEVPRIVPIYPMTNPSIIENVGVGMEALDSFSETTITKPVNADIRYILQVSSIDKYWDGAAWSNSDGTIAQSNTAAEIETNKMAIDFMAGSNFKIKSLLISTDGIVTPLLSTLTLTYDFFSVLDSFSKCIVFGYVFDGCNAVSGAAITFKSQDSFFTNDNCISINEETTSRSNGFFELILPETATASQSVDVKVSFIDSKGKKKTKELVVIVPNQSSAALEDIVV